MLQARPRSGGGGGSGGQAPLHATKLTKHAFSAQTWLTVAGGRPGICDSQSSADSIQVMSVARNASKWKSPPVKTTPPWIAVWSSSCEQSPPLPVVTPLTPNDASTGTLVKKSSAG